MDAAEAGNLAEEIEKWFGPADDLYGNCYLCPEPDGTYHVVLYSYIDGDFGSRPEWERWRDEFRHFVNS